MTDDGVARAFAQVPAFGAASIRRIDAVDVTCAYGREEALHRASCTFHAGKVSVMFGPNGAGKSTLLRCVSTLQRPTEGAVSFDQRLDGWRDRMALRAHVGLVAHESLLYHELTGRENLLFFAGLYGPDATRRVEPLLDAVGLRDAADNPVTAYSRGMRQRLSIARALVHAPSVVLFDEPLTGLDRDAVSLSWGLMRWLADAGRVVVVVTHRFDMPRALVDQMIVLERGRVRYAAPPADALEVTYARALRRRPAGAA